MKQVLFFVILTLIMTGCLPTLSPPIEVIATTTPIFIQTPSPTSGDIFEVQAWVNEPFPARDEQVIVYGSLIKDGVRLGGIMMRASWRDGTHEHAIPDCFVLVTYGRGVCTLDQGGLPSGVFLPITVTFDYNGSRFIGQTGFTPH
jgi:hypothetical protein